MDIEQYATEYKKTGEDKEIRGLLCTELDEIIHASDHGNISIAEFTELIAEVHSKASHFMRLIQ